MRWGLLLASWSVWSLVLRWLLMARCRGLVRLLLPMGRSGFQLLGGGGIASVILNSGAKGAENVLSIESGRLFFTKYMASDDFSEPLDALIPNIPCYFFLLPNFGSGSPPGPRGQSR